MSNSDITATHSKNAVGKRLAVFLVVTFALTWSVHIAAGTFFNAFEVGELAASEIIVFIAISMFFPLLGALIANRIGGASARIDLGFKPNLKGHVPSYLMAWFLPAILSLLGCVLFFVLNPSLFDPSLQGYIDSIKTMAQATGTASLGNIPSPEELDQMRPVIIASVLIASITYAPFLNMFVAFGEEAGWRGFLFPTLKNVMSVRAAVIVSGVIWGIWHAPIIAMGHNYGMGYAGFPWTGMLVMILACTALGAIACYLKEKTESIWSCSLIHGSVNATANLGVMFCVVGQTILGPSPLALIAGVPTFIAGIICLIKIDK